MEAGGACSDGRPEGLRPAQKSANSCENLRAYGRCKWGDDCYYSHSQEESELFAAWIRSQPQKVRGGAGGSRAGPAGEGGGGRIAHARRSSAEPPQGPHLSVAGSSPP